MTSPRLWSAPIRRLAGGVTALAFAAVARAAAADASPIATTTAGKIRGYVDTGVSVFKGAPYGDDTSKHLQEEIIIVKEGTVEANWDGKSKTGGPGSVIFFAVGATTFLRNAGATPCTYTVLYYYTPLTPKR